MRFVVIDIESYYDKDYTLSKLSTEEYVRDHTRFECFGGSIKWSQHHAAKWYDAPDFARIVQAEDWSDVCIICHHAQFDGLILSHYLGVRPKLWACTLSMARLLLGNHLSVSLDSVRKHFGLPIKRQVYDERKGMHWRDIPEDMKERIRDGCNDEVESIWQLFGTLAKDFPDSEYEIVDLTIRMFTEPVLRADVPLLQKLWIDEENKKTALRQAIGVTEDQLQSADLFTTLLEEAGVEVAYKEGKNGLIPAFAKTDQFMVDLLEDEDDYIRGLAEARLGAKSTLLQSRAETLGSMAGRGALCVYLRYCAAHTTRWGGGDKSNFQNFKRGSVLRRSLLAPDGYLILVIDLAQTECRLVNFLAGQTDVIDNFRNGHDPYVGIASQFYGRSITKRDEAERGTGKQAELSCGFGCGWKKFQRTAALGSYGPRVELTDEQAQRLVKLYRQSHRAVTDYWKDAGNQLPWINGNLARQWGPMTIRDKKIYLPNGTRINYDQLEWRADKKGEQNWQLKLRTGWTKMYGAKLVENVVQALARVVASDGMLRLNRAGFRPIMSSHDDVAVLVKRDGHEQEAVDFCVNAMKQEPTWLPGIPLGAEHEIGERYEK